MKERFYRAVRQPVGKLRQELPGPSRILVFYRDPFSEEYRACWPLNDVPELSAVAQKVIATCAKRQRTVALHDAEVDPLTVGMGGAEFRSALAVPILDSSSTPIGILYAENSEPGVFGREQKMMTERLARAVSPKLPVWSPLPTPEQRGSAEPPPIDIRMVGLIGALSIFFLVSWAFSLRERSRQPPPPPPVQKLIDERPRAERAMGAFVNLLRMRNYEQAWRLLHPDLQERVELERFVQASYTWFADPGNSWDFGHRSLRTESRGEREAIFRLDPHQDLEGRPWRWVARPFPEEGTAGEVADEPASEPPWRIVSLEGGPYHGLVEP